MLPNNRERLAGFMEVGEDLDQLYLYELNL